MQVIETKMEVHLTKYYLKKNINKNKKGFKQMPEYLFEHP